MNCVKCNCVTDNPKFCSRSCAVSYNNKGIVRNGESKPPCIQCNGKVDNNNKQTKFCSMECSNLHKANLLKIKIVSNGATTHYSLKNFLVAESNKCSACGIGNEYNGKPLTLELDHIDGDRANNVLSNVRLLCPNCHSQTETFRFKNFGNPKGKESRAKRYKNWTPWGDSNSQS